MRAPWRRRGLALALCLALAPAAGAGWWEVWQADEGLDLARARELALAAMADDPRHADAVAAAMWWLVNLDNLPSPEEPLSLLGGDRDPELGFVLARMEAELRSRPPDGALSPAELAGPFGVLSTLDLERSVVPEDGGLPPLGTRWREPALPFRMVMGTVDGFHGPPAAAAVHGVYLAAWTLEVASELEGWLVVEAQGGYNLELDGRAVDSRRECGITDPVATWYRLRLAPGTHRLRAEIASPGTPRVRVSLLDGRGAAAAGVRVEHGAAVATAPSEIVRQEPAAAAALGERIRAGDAGVSELLLAARLAAGRGDPQGERELVERAREWAPDDPWVALALARGLFVEGGGMVAGERVRRLTQLLREAADIPGAVLIERGLAVREGRAEDAERLLDRLLAEHRDDVRVLDAWVREAVRRGWAREAEDDLVRLEALLPESPGVIELRLAVLAQLERWEERERLLRAAATAPAAGLRWIDDLTASCTVQAAIAALEAARSELRHPDLDVRLATLYSELGDRDSGLAALERARESWGDLPALDELALMLAGGDAAALDAALAEALARAPSNLQLLTLAWRRGAEPFFAPFVVEARDFAAAHRDLGGDVDVVLLLDQAVERIFADGSSLYYYHGISRPNTPAGVRRASVIQPLAEASLLKIRILKPDGSVVVPSELRADDGFVELTGVEPGDLVEEEYVAEVPATGASRRGHLPPYLYRFADPDRAFGLSEYVLLVPPEIELLVDGNFEGLEHEEQTWGELRMLSWRAEQVPPMASEPFAPPAQELMPWLNYGFGVTWQDVGDIIRDRLLPVLRSSRELREWGRSALVGGSPQAELESLMRALVETVEAGDRDLDLAVTAADTFAARRGSRLLVAAAVLAEAGWQVDLVLTRPWNERGRHLRVPTLDAFPAAVLRVAKAGEELWLDLREEVSGVDHVGALFQGSDGLVLPLTDPGRAVELLDRLPVFDNPELVERVIVRARVAASGDADVDFRMPIRGAQAEQLQQRVASLPAEQAQLMFRQMAANVFPGADRVEGEIERGTDGTAIRLRLTAPSACEPDGDGLLCRNLVLARPLVPVLVPLPERRYPLVLRLPLERRLTLELEPPPGWRVEERRPRRLETGWGSVDETLVVDGGVHRSVLEIGVPAQTVPPESYAVFARFCQAVDELAGRPPRLLPIRP